jgi:hypothetical protein
MYQGCFALFTVSSDRGHGEDPQSMIVSDIVA